MEWHHRYPKRLEHHVNEAPLRLKDDNIEVYNINRINALNARIGEKRLQCSGLVVNIGKSAVSVAVR